MPRKTVEKTINGRRLQIQQVGAETGDTILYRLVLGVGLDKITVQDIIFAKKELMACTKVGIVDKEGDGRVTFVPLESQYDEIFSDDLEGRLAWLAAAWEVSFGPFSDVKKKFAQFQKALSSSISPTMPDGSSTDSSYRTA